MWSAAIKFKRSDLQRTIYFVNSSVITYFSVLKAGLLFMIVKLIY